MRLYRYYKSLLNDACICLSHELFYEKHRKCTATWTNYDLDGNPQRMQADFLDFESLAKFVMKVDTQDD